MKSTALSSSTPSPSTEAENEQKVEQEVMMAPQVKTDDLKDDIKGQVQGKDDFLGTNTIDEGHANQDLQRAEQEHGLVYIEDSEQVSKQIEHPVDLIVMSLPTNPIGLSEIKSIISKVSQ